MLHGGGVGHLLRTLPVHAGLRARLAPLVHLHDTAERDGRGVDAEDGVREQRDGCIGGRIAVWSLRDCRSGPLLMRYTGETDAGRHEGAFGGGLTVEGAHDMDEVAVILA